MLSYLLFWVVIPPPNIEHAMRSRRPVQKKKKNDRARKMLKMKNPKSFRKPNGVTKRTKARNTERTSILSENLLKNNDIYAGANHLRFQDGGIIFCNACETDISFENSKCHYIGKNHQGKCKILANKKFKHVRPW